MLVSQGWVQLAKAACQQVQDVALTCLCRTLLMLTSMLLHTCWTELFAQFVGGHEMQFLNTIRCGTCGSIQLHLEGVMHGQLLKVYY